MTAIDELSARRTFAIISHPDAGKTTLTEKLLLMGGAIQTAGSVKGRKAARHATSDWMALEQQRGISVTTSVMQFLYQSCVFNLLDTPGHADFSEDTYRTLTAVDSALMVIDAVKGVEARTIKLLEVCRLRQTPIMTFMNKLDRETREPIELLDEVESVLNIQCAPMTWPVGMGRHLKGVYHLYDDVFHVYEATDRQSVSETSVIQGLESPELLNFLGETQLAQLKEELELVQGATEPFDLKAYLEGRQTPVFFGTAMHHFGVQELLNAFASYAPQPMPRETDTRDVLPEEAKFSGFVFKIQANMDPAHRDRMAFLRICSGQFKNGMKLLQVRTGKQLKIAQAQTFMAAGRAQAETAHPGDIIGLHNHGTIQIGDTFTEGETLKFKGVPHFSPELFKRVVLKDPLKSKALLKGLQQLSEEGAVQLFRPLENNDLVIGAVGVLQFDVVAYRLKDEYKVECAYAPVNVACVRWVQCSDEKIKAEFQKRLAQYLALDGGDYLTYLAPSMAHLGLTQERWEHCVFSETREV